MTITSAFGFTADFEQGTTRRWTIGADGIKRWADTGEAVTDDRDQRLILSTRQAIDRILAVRYPD